MAKQYRYSIAEHESGQGHVVGIEECEQCNGGEWLEVENFYFNFGIARAIQLAIEEVSWLEYQADRLPYNWTCANYKLEV